MRDGNKSQPVTQQFSIRDPRRVAERREGVWECRREAAVYCFGIIVFGIRWVMFGKSDVFCSYIFPLVLL